MHCVDILAVVQVISCGLNLNYAAEEDLVEYYSWRLHILVKRLFYSSEHIAHMYFKIGPSIAHGIITILWIGHLATETRIGVFYGMGVQTQVVVKGIKFFAEAEFRGYSPASVE